ncbi:TolB family protein [Paenibacillus gansuensis]|uniref:Lipoprotein n=1 Tax=Paenibacillus gansuensis TaxID=306542 RepID=A0ABW5PLP6_9BACL
MRNQWRVICAAAGLALLLSGCGQAQVQNEKREVVDKEGKRLTVIDQADPVEKVQNQVVLDKIDILKGMRGMDWLSEDQLVVARKNVQLAKEQPVTRQTDDGELSTKEHPFFNLYVHDLGTGQDRLLHGEQADQTAAVVSPDKAHIFYKKTVGETGNGFIMDVATGTPVQTGKEELTYMVGEWADAEHVVMSSIEGSLLQADVRGNVETVLKTGETPGSLYSVSRRGDLYYYIVNREELKLYNAATKEKKLLMKDTVWATPSQDGRRLAIVRRTKDIETELMFSDPEGKTTTSIAKGTQIFGSSWSPDGKFLAYTVTKENSTSSNLFVVEAETGRATQLALEIPYIADPVKWSPSGKQLMVSSSVIEGRGINFEMYVIKLK